MMQAYTEEQRKALIEHSEHMLTLTAPSELSTQLFKIALAALTAGPVLYRDSQGCFVTKLKGEKLIKAGELVKPLYTAPPAPALRLPEEKRVSLATEIVEHLVDCGSADEEAIERYTAWVIKRLNATAQSAPDYSECPLCDSSYI
ncbi:hypothetical protein [Pantoea piersonii]|uniref:hypothetical protein n=1 Tax=Pantoea piersonii TaxID=2364647 RepID=UPI002FD9E903